MNSKDGISVYVSEGNEGTIKAIKSLLKTFTNPNSYTFTIIL